jgi:hypothetical protein
MEFGYGMSYTTPVGAGLQKIPPSDIDLGKEAESVS